MTKVFQFMSIEKVGLKATMTRTLVWLIIFPFLASWPFVSAFPLFSLMNSTGFDITTTLNIIFFLSGFWPLTALIFAAFALMYEDARQAQYKALRGSGPWIGGYAILWTGLYLISVIASRWADPFTWTRCDEHSGDRLTLMTLTMRSLHWSWLILFFILGILFLITKLARFGTFRISPHVTMFCRRWALCGPLVLQSPLEAIRFWRSASWAISFWFRPLPSRRCCWQLLHESRVCLQSGLAAVMTASMTKYQWAPAGPIEIACGVLSFVPIPVHATAWSSAALMIGASTGWRPSRLGHASAWSLRMKHRRPRRAQWSRSLQCLSILGRTCLIHSGRIGGASFNLYRIVTKRGKPRRDIAYHRIHIYRSRLERPYSITLSVMKTWSARSFLKCSWLISAREERLIFWSRSFMKFGHQ